MSNSINSINSLTGKPLSAPYVLGKQGERKAIQILESMGFSEIKRQSHSLFYDFSAEKNGLTYHIEVKTRTGDIFQILSCTARKLLEVGNGLLLLIHEDNYKLIPIDVLTHRLAKGSTVLGLSFHKNYGSVNNCNRCGHLFFTDSAYCPKCKSPYWNKPYQGISHE